MDWFRSYHGAPVHPKWRVIARDAGSKAGIVAAIAWRLFDIASQHPERGTVFANATERTLRIAEIAAAFDFDEDEVGRVIASMERRNSICDGRIRTWEKRQPKREDGSAERARAWRAERNRTQPNARLDKSRLEKKDSLSQPRAKRAVLDAGQVKIFEEWYAIYPLHKARLQAERAFLGALARASPAELLAGAARYRDECVGKEPRYIAHPATWLNAGRWKDENGLNGISGVANISERRTPKSPPPKVGNGQVGLEAADG